jgi:hypothetical protein
VSDSILGPPSTWLWSPLELHAQDKILDFAIEQLQTTRLEEITTKDLQDEDELDGFAAAILEVSYITTLDRDDEEQTLMVHTQYEGVDYIYFERDNGDIAGLIRERK